MIVGEFIQSYWSQIIEKITLVKEHYLRLKIYHIMVPPVWKYTLITDDENAINDFLLAQEIEKVIKRV